MADKKSSKGKNQHVVKHPMVGRLKARETAKQRK